MSGGGGGGNQTTTSVTELPEYIQPYANDYLKGATAIYDDRMSNPSTYDGQRVADLTDQQIWGMDQTQKLGMNGNDMYNSAQTSGENTLTGDYFGNGLGDNGYIGQAPAGYENGYMGQTTAGYDNGYMGDTTTQASNQYLGNVTPGTNAMLGQNNPHLAAAIQNTQQSMADEFLNTVSPQLQAAQVSQGAFGNTGLQQQQNKAMSDLMSNMGQASNDMRMQDYNLQAQLGESDLNRRLKASTTQAQLGGELSQFNAGLEQRDLGRNAGLAQDQGQFNSTLSQRDLGRNSQLAQDQGQFNADLNQNNWITNLQGTENQLNRKQNAWNDERLNQLDVMRMSPTFMNQDFTNANMVTGTGDAIRDYNQDLLNEGYQKWWEEDNSANTSLDILGNALRGSIGGGGTTTTTAPNPNQPNSIANAIGSGLLTYGALGGGTAAASAAAPWLAGGAAVASLL